MESANTDFAEVRSGVAKRWRERLANLLFSGRPLHPHIPPPSVNLSHTPLLSTHQKLSEHLKLTRFDVPTEGERT